MPTRVLILAPLPTFCSASVRDVSEAGHFYRDVLGPSTSVALGMLTLTFGTGAHGLMYRKIDRQPAPSRC